MKLPVSIAEQLQKVLHNYSVVSRIVQTVSMRGGTVFLVGGAVRDLLLGLPVKDLDFEVHGITLIDLELCLEQFGPVSMVGKAYGVLRLHNLDADWSLPRTDSSGRHPLVTIDPYMSLQQAFARRDVTINALGIDLHSFELVDPFNGLQDLKDGILRATDERFFIEDPLRFYRVMQFIGRFEFYPDDALQELCKHMDVSSVSGERIEKEFEKLLLRSKRPSLGFRWLKAIGRLQELLPELAATLGIEQEAQWHPEGDVFEHLMQSLDAAARLQSAHDFTKLIITYAALCHDLGKVTTTRVIDGRIRSLGHDAAGVAPTESLLKRITRNQDLIEAVAKLVQWHMQPILFLKGGAKSGAYKRLAYKLAPQVSLNLLADLFLVDKQGRNAQSHEPLTTIFPEVLAFKEQAAALHILDKPEEAVLLGRDLLDVVPAGKQLGVLLKKAYQIQLEEGITDKQTLKKRVLS